MNVSSVEPAWVITQVAERAGVSEEQAAGFIDVAHHVVDRLITDDVSVIAPPLVVAFPDDPVYERLRFLARDHKWDLGRDGFDASDEERAAALRLPMEIVERYPWYGPLGVLIKILDQLGAPGAYERWAPVLDAWLETYRLPSGDGRRYRVTPVGKESVFEAWLEAHLSVLKDFGYPVRLADEAADGIRGRQPMLDRRSIPDLVCRFTEDCEEGNAEDWLVIENKATAVGQAALHQLSRYVDLLPARVGARREQVYGLLLADGSSVNLRRGLEEAGLDYLSLTALGYRDHLRGLAGFLRDPDPDATSIPHPESRPNFDEDGTGEVTGEDPDPT